MGQNNSSKVYVSDKSSNQSSSPSHAIHNDRRKVARMMLPVYFVEKNRCSQEELEIAKRKWTMILNSTSPHFLMIQEYLRENQLMAPPSCISLFFDLFYSRLFDLHPLCRPMFSSGLKSQGKFLVQMMTMTLSLADKDAEFDEAMIKLASVHNNRGVKALEYGVVGEVLFWTLKQCLGPEYDSNTHLIWVKLFSRMLSVIVPHAVEFEASTGLAQIERLRVQQSLKLENTGSNERESSEYSKSQSTAAHSTSYMYIRSLNVSHVAVH